MFGLPFLSIMVAASFALENFTRTRYDYQASRVQTMSWEEDMGIKQNRKKIDLREEYYVSCGSLKRRERRGRPRCCPCLFFLSSSPTKH